MVLVRHEIPIGANPAAPRRAGVEESLPPRAESVPQEVGDRNADTRRDPNVTVAEQFRLLRQQNEKRQLLLAQERRELEERLAEQLAVERASAAEAASAEASRWDGDVQQSSAGPRQQPQQQQQQHQQPHQHQQQHQQQQQQHQHQQQHQQPQQHQQQRSSSSYDDWSPERQAKELHLLEQQNKKRFLALKAQGLIPDDAMDRVEESASESWDDLETGEQRRREASAEARPSRLQGAGHVDDQPPYNPLPFRPAYS